MKMVKSLLLVSAAGLVASAGAQAADLPVKAKPVEYVKVCSLYGAGFYYIPGTDICLKLYGYVRYQADYGTSSITAGPFAGSNVANNRLATQDWAGRARTIVGFDTRQQTAYGTLRAYMNVGFTKDTNANAGYVATAGIPTPMYANRAFIQLAGFTWGLATSYFDFVSTAAVAYNAGFTHAPDTGDAGQLVAAYTATLGNGVSASLSFEQSRRNNTSNLNLAAFGVPTGAFVGDNLSPSITTFAVVAGTNNNSSNLPDVVGNLRIDQAWGSAQIAGALHDVGAGYYSAAPAPFPGVVAENNGHPGDKWGWAITPGLKVNFPMIGPGDYFQGALVYTQGAVRYASNTPIGGGSLGYYNGNKFAFGQAPDAVFQGNAAGTAGFLGTGIFDNSIHLTTAWSVFASYEHFWTPALRTDLYGSYLAVRFDSTANTMMCAGFAAAIPGAGTPATGCNMNWNQWDIGTRSQWNITKDFYIGLDVIYSRLETATLGGTGSYTIAPSATLGKPLQAGYNTSNENAVTGAFRVHRDIVP
jgi:hypothetical protein